jgi:hypothetical protein
MTVTQRQGNMMTPEQISRAGTDTAQWMLLKHLWAVALRFDTEPHAAFERVSRTLLDHANDAPMAPNPIEGVSAEDLELVRQHTIETLEQFWDGVRTSL